MRTLFRTITLAALTTVLGLSAQAQGEASEYFNKGSVYRVNMVKTEANSQDDYLLQLRRVYIPMMKAAQEAGLILSYKILTGTASNAADFDMLLLVEFKNMAAFDETPESDAKWKAMREKVLSSVGGKATQDDVQKAYEKIRTITGYKLMRERTLK